MTTDERMAESARLKEGERDALDAILVALWQCETEGGYQHMRAKAEGAVERIIAARLAEQHGATCEYSAIEERSGVPCTYTGVLYSPGQERQR